MEVQLQSAQAFPHICHCFNTFIRRYDYMTTRIDNSRDFVRLAQYSRFSLKILRLLNTIYFICCLLIVYLFFLSIFYY
jgi:hypothetical protein